MLFGKHFRSGCSIGGLGPWLTVALVIGCSSIHKPGVEMPKFPLADKVLGPAPADAQGFVDQIVAGLRERTEPDRARERFAKGDELFREAAGMDVEHMDRKKKFMAAGREYVAAARFWPGSSLEEDALMMSAESLFFADLYQKSVNRQAELLKKYPTTRHLDRIDQRRFAISEFWLDYHRHYGMDLTWINVADPRRPGTDTFGHAIKLLDRIRFDNPTGKLADDATMLAAVANFEKKNYSEADVLLTDIRQNFPRSEHQFQAHLLGLKCKRELYRGADYDGGVLEESQQIIQQIARLFPEESAEHQEALRSELKEIRLQMAQRDYNMAQFFDNREEYGAARVYYELVREEYHDTNLALESESRLCEDWRTAPRSRILVGVAGGHFSRRGARQAADRPRHTRYQAAVIPREQVRSLHSDW